MEEMYSRNLFYIPEKNQESIRKIRLLLGGAGIGSNIAECALRFGFENLTIIDGDKVELSNLNRQNYTRSDIGKFKAEALAERLLKINPSADIRFHCEFITNDNLHRLIDNCDIAVNALDFKNEIPLKFDERCRAINAPILHPYNFGWGGLLMIVTPNSLPISSIMRGSNPQGFELEMAKYVSEYCQFWNLPENSWLHPIVENYIRKKNKNCIPQLSVGSWIIGAMCVDAMYRIAIGEPIKVCPKFYLTSMFGDRIR